MKFYSYPKIPTICKRAEDGTHALTSEFATDSLKVLSSLTWMGTEKIDGTNCGIVWDGHKIGFQGRTEDAAINAKHFAYLQETFQTEEVAQIFEQKFGERPVGLVVGTIASVAILATIIFGAITIYKSHKECKEAEEAWQRAHKKHMEELDRLIAEANQSSKKGKKSGSK